MELRWKKEGVEEREGEEGGASKEGEEEEDMDIQPLAYSAQVVWSTVGLYVIISEGTCKVRWSIREGNNCIVILQPFRYSIFNSLCRTAILCKRGYRYLQC